MTHHKQSEALQMRERAYAICNDQKLPLDTRQLAFVLAGGFTSLHNHITSLESQFAAIGAGGVEPLRKRACLHQIAEPAGERTAKDYAIEHAEYMAQAAERLLSAINTLNAQCDEDGAAFDEAEQAQAEEAVSEAFRAMRRGIHEFRKRRDRALRAQAAPAAVEGPSGLDHCPITGRKFWGNIEHPELGLVATYGGPFDTYTIPAISDDGELRCERFDQDAGHWVEGGEPAGWLSDDQPDSAPTTQAAPQHAVQQMEEIDAAVEKAWDRFQAALDKNEPLPPPSVHATAHYGTWLGREAHRHDEPKAGAFRNAARMLSVLEAEIRRLHAELIAANPASPVAQGDAEVLLISAVDEWFAKNTGLGGCSDEDVRELRAIFAAHPAAPVAQGDATRAAARALSNRVAEMCNVDKEDHWKYHSDDVLSDAELVISTYLAAQAKAAPAPAAQGDALPREDFAWMVVQEACETEPADEDDPECIRILRLDLKSAVLSAFLREDAARTQAKEGGA